MLIDTGLGTAHTNIHTQTLRKQQSAAYLSRLHASTACGQGYRTPRTAASTPSTAAALAVPSPSTTPPLPFSCC